MLVLAPLKLICASGSSGLPIRAIAIENTIDQNPKSEIKCGYARVYFTAWIFQQHCYHSSVCKKN
jgi:hypothetical protein